jgi:hypothetical protein
MPYGIHHFLKSDCRYVTLLRQPVDRVISAYYHVRRVPEHPLHARVMSDMTIGEFARHSALDNDQTRRLANHNFSGELTDHPYRWDTTPKDDLAERHLEEALATLELCEFVGFTEYLSRDIVRLFRLLDLQLPEAVPRLNATDERPQISEIDEGTIALIREHNRFDVRLYDEALRRRRSKFPADLSRRSAASISSILT